MEFKLFTVKSRGWIFKSYDIFLEDKLKYHVKSSPFIKTYKLYDQHGLELIQIKRVFAFFKLEFNIKKFDSVIAKVQRGTQLFKNDLHIISNHGTYYANGNFRANDFTILKGEDEVAKISRHGPFAGKKYGVALVAEEDELLMLSIVMVIEMVVRIKRARKSG